METHSDPLCATYEEPQKMVSGSRMTSTQLAVCPFHLRELEGSGWVK